jgi:CO/xanthine dehydrogenase Mo-binding subunit
VTRASASNAGSWRKDGVQKATGEARYTADLTLPGMVAARLVTADVPCGRISAIDTSAALALPGVLAVLTHRDVPKVLHGYHVADRPLFASDAVRFDGEIVAAIAALTPEIADRAAELVELEIEAQAPLLDPEAALLPDAPLVHPDWERYGTAHAEVVRDRNDCGFVTIEKGDVEAGLAAADHVVEQIFTTEMSHPVPIETHAVLAAWEGSRVTVWTTSQMPFNARTRVAETLAMRESDVRVIVPHLGGGFGGKCDFHFEAHVAALARAARRPVRLVLDRRAEFTLNDQLRHPIRILLRSGISRDGTLLAREAELILDTGAYASHGPAISELATMMAVGPYRIPNIRAEAHTVYTNKTPAGSVRGPSGPQVCWAVEQHTEELAARVGMSGLEFRRRNLVAEGDTGPTGQLFEPTGTVECLEQAADAIGYEDEHPVGEGTGLACGWWFSYPEPSGAIVKMNEDGTATVITGAQENGSGSVMGFPKLVAAELGLDEERVSIVYQDTDLGPYDLGSGGSQTTFNNGRAILSAVAVVKRRLAQLAADELEASEADLVFDGNGVFVAGSPGRAVPLEKLTRDAQANGTLVLAAEAPAPPPHPENFGASCAGRAHFPAFAAPSFFVHAARVRVDRETGVVEVAKVAAVHNSGTILHRSGARGQVEGGVVHGIGIALSERTELAADGRQVNPHLTDYKLQTIADVPEIVVSFVELPASEGPRGARALGEPPVIPTAGAVANAIADASGARVRTLPMTAERVLAALGEPA